MKKRHKANSYKFTEKTHSKEGMTALGLAVISLITLVVLVLMSARNSGLGDVMPGIVGAFAAALAVGSFFVAIVSLKDEKHYKAFPMTAFFTGLVAVAGWIYIYVTGFIS